MSVSECKCYCIGAIISTPQEVELTPVCGIFVLNYWFRNFGNVKSGKVTNRMFCYNTTRISNLVFHKSISSFEPIVKLHYFEAFRECLGYLIL